MKQTPIIPSFFICVSFVLLVLVATSEEDSEYVNGALLASAFITLATSFSFWMNPCERVCEGCDFQRDQDPRFTGSNLNLTCRTPQPSITSFCTPNESLDSCRTPNETMSSFQSPNESMSSYQTLTGKTSRYWTALESSSSSMTISGSLMSLLPPSLTSSRESVTQPLGHKESGIMQKFVICACIVAGLSSGLAFYGGIAYIFWPTLF